MAGDDVHSLLLEVERTRRVLTAPRSPRDLPVADPTNLQHWKRFLQEDARLNGGTAGVLLHDGSGGLVKITCCAQVVVTESVTDPIEVAMELDAFWRETD